jgi:hypothetical protein
LVFFLVSIQVGWLALQPVVTSFLLLSLVAKCFFRCFRLH